MNAALNIPLEELAQHIGDLFAYRERPVAIICTTDRKSKKAARLLNRAGFSDVRVVAGGMTQWNQYNWPIEHDGPH